MTRTVAGAALAALLAAAVAAQDKGPKPPDKKAPPPNPFAGLPQLDSSANYLARVTRIRSLRAAAKDRERDMYAQMLAAEAAFVGRHKEALELMDGAARPVPAAKDAA